MITCKNLRNTNPHQPYHIKVDRSNKVLGNQFIQRDKSLDERDRVCDLYDKWLKRMISIKNAAVCNELNRLVLIHRKYNKLELFCWCIPLRCHSQSIKEVLDQHLNKDK